MEDLDHYADRLRAALDPSLQPCLDQLLQAARFQEAVQAAAIAQAEAQRADQAKSAFLANMSHELRTPLNAIIGYTELVREQLEDCEVPGPVDADLQRVLGSGRHLLALIDDVLDLSKIESGQLRLDLQTVDVWDLVRTTAEQVRPQLDGNRLALDIVGEHRSVVDPLRLKQVVLNLLANAIKFTRNGTIQVRCERRPGAISIAVQDEGRGIAPDRLQAVFEPFVQAAESDEGTGLGLAICRRLCELMAGELHARSALGRGSCFEIVLPEVPS